jgi:LCP family protein required for cell wall assembly
MRRTIRRAAIGTLALLLTTALAVTGLAGAWLAGVKIPFASGATYMKVERLQSARAAGEPKDGLIFVALMGNDYRPGVGGYRGDALHLVGINVAQRRGTIIDFPRDICFGGGKINAVRGSRGPRAMADAIGQLAGVRPQYLVDVDFAGFVALVDGVGGVEVNVEHYMNDRYTGARFDPGLNHMNGGQALAYARDRHDFPSSDLQRTVNQGHMIIEGVRQLQRVADNPAGRFKVLTLLARHAQLDGVGLAELFRLGEIAYRVNADQVRNVPAPTVGGGCSGGLSLAGTAAALFADFRDDAILQSH